MRTATQPTERRVIISGMGNGFAGVVIPETVTVCMGSQTDFRYGFSAFSDLTDGANVRVVGLLVKNPTTGQAVLLARHVDGFDFTDFN